MRLEEATPREANLLHNPRDAHVLSHNNALSARTACMHASLVFASAPLRCASRRALEGVRENDFTGAERRIVVASPVAYPLPRRCIADLVAFLSFFLYLLIVSLQLCDFVKCRKNRYNDNYNRYPVIPEYKVLIA